MNLDIGDSWDGMAKSNSKIVVFDIALGEWNIKIFSIQQLTDNSLPKLN